MNALIENGNCKIFGNAGFRSMQKDIIKATMMNEDVFVLMPTGGGKSLCYQLPAVLSPGITIVVSPLISLIQDQVTALLTNTANGKPVGIPAAFLTSQMNAELSRGIEQDLNKPEPHLKLLYLTPEKIASSDSMWSTLEGLYRRNMLARFAIDEAHCVSQWGHDFRPDYKKLGALRKHFPKVPILALTATAPKTVVGDVQKVLRMKNTRVFSMCQNRKNLEFNVVHKEPSKFAKQQLLAYLKSFGYDKNKETGIIYCMTQQESKDVADFLLQHQIHADYYHAGQTNKDRQLVQSAWQKGIVKIMCATIAYGMGIDKPDVRFVLHFSMAKSMEGYYQEAGRAGRDGKFSKCTLFYNGMDCGRLKRILQMPGKGKTNQVRQKHLQHLITMQDYCTDETSCRRKLLVTYFGQTFNRKDCNNTCDNCKKYKR